MNVIKSKKTDKKTKTNFHVGRRARQTIKFLLDLDFNNFAEHEMLEFLLYAGIPLKDTNILAHLLIETFGSFAQVFDALPEELMSVMGMTERASCTIASVIPIARWLERSRTSKTTYLKTHAAAIAYLSTMFINRSKEIIVMISLDAQDRVIAMSPLGNGEASLAFMSMQQLVVTACRNNAVRIILAHNHPGGCPYPSHSDVLTTNKVLLVTHAMGIELIDHIIFTPQKEYFSFYEDKVLMALTANFDSIVGSSFLRERRSYRFASEMNSELSQFMADSFKQFKEVSIIDKIRNYFIENPDIDVDIESVLAKITPD